ADIDAIIVRRPDFVLARTVRALLAIELGNPSEAVADLRVLDLHTAELDRLCVLTWLARAEIENVSFDDRNAWTDVWNRAQTYLDRASAVDQRFASWLVQTVI